MSKLGNRLIHFGSGGPNVWHYASPIEARFTMCGKAINSNHQVKYIQQGGGNCNECIENVRLIKKIGL